MAYYHVGVLLGREIAWICGSSSFDSRNKTDKAISTYKYVVWLMWRLPRFCVLLQVPLVYVLLGFGFKGASHFRRPIPQSSTSTSWPDQSIFLLLSPAHSLVACRARPFQFTRFHLSIQVISSFIWSVDSTAGV